MPVNRRAVLEQLAAASDAEREETTTIDTLVSALDADERTIEAHIDGLEACELARTTPDGNVRVTITGEEFLELDTDEMIIVDSATPSVE